MHAIFVTMLLVGCIPIITGSPVTTIETVTIIKIDLQNAEDNVVKNAVDFLKRHNFSSKTLKIQGSDGKSSLETTLSKYYQSEYIDAEEYDLIRTISEDGWRSVKRAFISLVEHAHNNTVKATRGGHWSMELIPPNPDTVEYTPVEMSMLGFALRLSYSRDCDVVPDECTAILLE